jgi:hypothetical protein
MKKLAIAAILLCAPAVYAAPKTNKKEQPKPPSALDKYIEQASQPNVRVRRQPRPVRCGLLRRGFRIWRQINACGA